MPKINVIEIDSLRAADIVAAFVPELAELDYEKELHGTFLVVGWPEKGLSWHLNEINFMKHFDHLETDGFRLKVLHAVI